MQAHEKKYIKVGTMLSDGEDKIYRVTSFVYSEGITYKHGDPVEDNIVHVDIYSINNLETPIGNKDFVHLNFVQPLPIKKEFLDVLGFEDSVLNGQNIYRLNDVYFDSLQPVNNIYTLKCINDNHKLFHVQYVHQVQFIVAKESWF